VDTLKITDVRTICTAPEGIRLVVVRVETDEPGLYGLGCATFTQRPLAVVTAVEQYLKPFLLGKHPDNIEDIYLSAYVSSYRRSGPVLNNALSGVGMALWDIKGKRAGMPLYQLFGGKWREAAALYTYADGGDFRDVEENVRRYVEEGYRYVRCQVAIPGFATYGADTASGGGPQSLGLGREAFEPTAYCRVVPRLFEHLRSSLGEEVELLHDVHERIPPIQAIGLAKELEPHRLFFRRTLSRRRTSSTSASSDSRLLRPSPWGSSTSIKRSTCRSSVTV
jgi:mannonate dehydratase